ncbi:hypothetical protein [Stigmatella aurantiaca]|uniref:Conserved uncharacterized protein n=1 Tax=Stigmatella aurantiaca (strain DW4/3-1) TaxID=378806 RepID=Q092Q4_STIAD|nr:hypothetical protein [Stigmatella aurantiaca]ADO70737.1 conserved uncharacterized protein [Stigmatella aurantiaca DW4/3-1]EAU66684.1 hypothetical protein STIAU_4260 [Stigmatella aurantiaca DW4/3-1]
MEPIGRRPSTFPSPTSAPRAEARPATATAVKPANTVGQVQRSSFEAPVAQTAAAQPMPGAWRGGPDTPVGKAIAGMITRMRNSEAAGIQIKGDTTESLFTRAILDNKHVSNEQLLAISQVKLEQLATSPEDRAKVLKKVPNARELDVHKFTVGMLASATGIDPKKLSEACPDLGLTGAPGTPLLYAAEGAGMQRSTALHDFTDYLRGAGVKGMNKAVWGVENRILSAVVSAVGGGRY